MGHCLAQYRMLSTPGPPATKGPEPHPQTKSPHKNFQHTPTVRQNDVLENMSSPICVCVRARSVVQLCPFVTPWTVAHQAPLSMGFSRQKYWSGLPCPPPGDLPDPGIEPKSPALQADSLPCEPAGKLP